MKVVFIKYPVDVLICLLLSMVLIPVVLWNTYEMLRIILGLFYILFIPGYLFIFALFPRKKSSKGIDIITRIGLSCGLSIAIVPLLGLLLNYSPWGISQQSAFFFIFLFIFVLGFIGVYRWFTLNPKDRFTITINLSFSHHEDRLTKILTSILIVCIFISIALLLYIYLTPRQGEHFTEFYILGSDGKAVEYPSSLLAGENVTGIIGIVNHEHITMNYTVEIWLLQQTTFDNESSMENVTLFSHMWFVDKIKVTLDHVPLISEPSWTPQWERSFSYEINKTVIGKFMFLLFTDDTGEYIPNHDYLSIANEKIGDAYQSLYIWLKVR